jgi:Solute carrier family 35
MPPTVETPGAFSLPSEANIKALSDVKLTATESPTTATPLLRKKPRPFRFVATWHFWGILVLGQVLSWCIVSTNTLTEYLSLAGANIPAFQTVFNYALLNLVYTSYTIYRYGFKKWGRLLWKDGWKYFILGFADVQGVRALCPRAPAFVSA